MDPLPSWNEGATKRSIVDFVIHVTDPASPDFVPEAERIATFDNDGTLWSEKPAYFQLLFAIDRVKALAPEHPEWGTRQPFKAVLDGDMETLAAAGEHGLLELVMATHAGMTTVEFETPTEAVPPPLIVPAMISTLVSSSAATSTLPSEKTSTP